MMSISVNIPALIPYPGEVSRKNPAAAPAFPERLALRKERALTQQALADRVGIHVSSSGAMKAAQSQPTLDVIRNLAVALSISADLLLFGKDERGPDNDLRFQFEAMSKFDAEDKKTARALLDGLILRHQAKMLSDAGAK